MNQPYVYICPFPLESPSHLPPHSTPRDYQRAPDLHSLLAHSANSHWLSVLHMQSIGFHATLSICPTLSSPFHVHKSVLYVYISILALQIGSSVLSFWIPYICVNIWYLFFSFWLTSLCIIGSRFIQLIRTDSNVFLLWLSNIPLCICTTTSLSIHLSTDRLLPQPSYYK